MLDAFADAEPERAGGGRCARDARGARARRRRRSEPPRRGAPAGRLPAPCGGRDRPGQAQAGRGRGAGARGAPALAGRHAERARVAHHRGARAATTGRARRAGRRPTAHSPRSSRSIPPWRRWRELLDAAFANLDELARLAADYAGEVEDDPARLAELERRRDLLFRLTQKYGATLEAVLDTRDQSAAELDLLDTADLDLRALGARRADAEASLRAAADALSAKRRATADRLAAGSTGCCRSSGCRAASSGLAWRRSPSRRRTGRRACISMCSSTPGSTSGRWRRSRRAASSRGSCWRSRWCWRRTTRCRRWCSTKWIRASAGEIGVQVGEALAEVAERHQVLVITHLPQIAARADQHLVVSKEARGGLPRAMSRRSMARIACRSWPGCWATRRATRPGGTRRRCCGRKGRRGGKAVGRPGGQAVRKNRRADKSR